MLRIEIDGKLETNNALKRWFSNPRPHVGRALYRDYKSRLQKTILQGRAAAIRRNRADGRRKVVLRYYTKRLQDPDNFQGSLKPILDVLTQLHVIRDDSEQWIELDAMQEVSVDAYKTTITIFAI